MSSEGGGRSPEPADGAATDDSHFASGTLMVGADRIFTSISRIEGDAVRARLPCQRSSDEVIYEASTNQ